MCRDLENKLNSNLDGLKEDDSYGCDIIGNISCAFDSKIKKNYWK